MRSHGPNRPEQLAVLGRSQDHARAVHDLWLRRASSGGWRIRVAEGVSRLVASVLIDIPAADSMVVGVKIGTESARAGAATVFAATR